MKKLFVFLVVGIFLLTCVSAAQWDNTKKYDSKNKEVTIENVLGLGGDVARIKLTSPLNFQVARGYQKVAEFDLAYYMDNNGGLDFIEFFDIKDSMNKINRQFDYKIKTIEDVSINDYETICNEILTGNGTKTNNCIQNIIGSHTEERIVWNDFNEKDLKKAEQVTIGIFTDVQKGDKIEWIPTFYGVEIDEWATWTENLSVGLTSYYNFDETTGTTLTDIIGYNDGVNENATINQEGILGRAYYFNGVDSWVNLSSQEVKPKQLTLSFWYKHKGTGEASQVIIKDVPSSSGWTLEGGVTSTATVWNATTTGNSNAITFATDVWTHVVLIVNGTHIKIYQNGTQLGSPVSFIGDLSYGIGNAMGLGADGGGSNSINATIDELGIWNRSLSDAEILELWNNGSGITYTIITLNSPIDNYKTLNATITFNCSVSSNVGLTNLSFYLDGVINETNSSGVNNADYIFTKTLSHAVYNWTCGIVSSSNETRITTYRNLTILKVLENNRTFNATAYETAHERYSINLTANASLTAVDLFYNGTYFAMTKSGMVWSYERDLPSSVLGVQVFSYRYTYAGEYINSTNSTQTVNATIFGLCNATITDDFLNISFKDESNSSSINASIPTSTFEYYLGDGDETKTYQLINNTGNTNYNFCATPNRTLHIDPYVQYVSTSYPQRIWDPDVTNYNSNVTNQILYLLESTDGIYVTFQVTNPSNQVLSGVLVVITREIGGVEIEVGRGTTGTDGTITFWLNPDFVHTITTSRTGFTTLISTITPTQSTYTIILAGTSVQQIQDYSQGISISILPPITAKLYNNTNYNFNITITTSYWSLDAFGIFLKLRNGTIINSGSSTSSTGGNVNIVQNTSNHTAIGIGYWYTVNGTNMTSDHWIIIEVDDSGFSINTFINDLNSYIDSGLFGLDTFGKTLLIFIFLLITMGIMSYKYGFTSPMAVSFMAFLSVYLFDVVFGLLESPVDAIPNMYTWLIGLVTVVITIKEVTSR